MNHQARSGWTWAYGTGITEETYKELERLISDAKPCSRHLLGMSINLQVSGEAR